MTVTKRISLVVAGVLAVGAVVSDAAHAQSRKDGAMREVWTVDLPEQLRSRIYQAVVIAGDTPVVVATSPRHVVSFDGAVNLLFELKRGGATGETAILPRATGAGSLEELAIGVMEHVHHDVGRFRLVSAAGEPIAAIDDPRHFHYRVAPDGRSFVGMDALGKHAALAAERVIYRLFDRQGEPVAEFESRQPGSPDSAYTPDGAGFLVNGAGTGLSLYSTRDGQRLWNVPGGVRMFAAARAPTQRVLTVDEGRRDRATLYDSGKPVREMSLTDAGGTDAGGTGAIRNIAIAPGGDLAALSDDSQVMVLRPGSGSTPGAFRIGQGLTINSLAVSDRGLVAVGAQQAGLAGTEPATGRVFVLNAQAEPVFELGTDHRRSNAWIPTVQFDAGGRFLLVRTLEMVKLLALD